MMTHTVNKCWPFIVGTIFLSLTVILAEKSLTFAHESKQADGKQMLRGKVDQDVAAADALMLKGRFPEAAAIYSACINKSPKSSLALAGLGVALGKQFKLDAAQEYFDRALGMDAGNALAYAGRAMVLLNRLQSSSPSIIRNRDSLLKQAELECKQAISLDPTLPEAHYNFGLVLRELGNLDAAAREFSETLKLEPRFADAYAALGMTCIASGKLDLAEDNFRQAIALNSGNSTAHYGLGRVYLKQERSEDAIRELNTALYQAPNSAPIHEALGAVYESEGNFVAAIREYQESIRIKPENLLSYFRIADIRAARGDLEHSIAELHAALELVPDNAELHLRIANQSLQLEKVDEAVKEYVQALQLDPANASAAKGLARALYVKDRTEPGIGYFSSSEFADAAKLVDSACEANPKDIELALMRAKLQAASGRPVNLQAIGQPQSVAERLTLAELYFAQHQFDRARKAISELIEETAKGDALVAIGERALLIKDLDSAQSAFDKALSLKEQEPRARRGLNAVRRLKDHALRDLKLANDMMRRNQLGTAIDKYQMAVYNNPKLGDARLGLAHALESIHEPSAQDLREAVVQYKVFLALEPDLEKKEKEHLERHLAKLGEKADRLDRRASQSRPQRLRLMMR